MSSRLMQRVALGEKNAMHDCIGRYGGLVWSIARRLTRTSADAEDATQDVFLEIWRHANRFDEALGSEPGFIATIARRRLIDRLRKTTAEPPMETSPEILESAAWVFDDSADSASSVDAEQAVRALATLRPQQRQVLELGFLHGLTHSEIAKRLNMPLGSVKSCMRRGLFQVRDFLKASDKALHVAATSPAPGVKRQRGTAHSGFGLSGISKPVMGY